MSDRETGTPRPSGQTSGSPEREPHRLDEPLVALDLAAEASELRREPAWEQGDRNAKTFVKADDLRLILAVLKEGARLREHRVPGTATLQMLTGR